MKLMRWSLVAVLLGLAMMMTSGSAATLTVGSDAPKLQTGKWIQGEPVKEFEKGKVYMVEFWATWCPPCLESIPHINELHKKYGPKGFVIIGQDAPDEEASDVQKFVKRMGDKMTYRVAMDDTSKSADGAMWTAWMEAAGKKGIPFAFLVDGNGKIAWLGSPFELKESVIEELLAGKHDLAKAKVDYETRMKLEADAAVLEEKLSAAVREKKWDAAEAALAELEKLEDPSIRQQVGLLRVRVSLEKKDPAAAEKAALAFGEKTNGEPRVLDGVAWALVTYDKPTPSMIAAAEKLIVKANDEAKSEDANILDTMARVKFLKGDKEGAVAASEKAVSFAKEGRQKDHYTRNLNLFKKGELPEE